MKYSTNYSILLIEDDDLDREKVERAIARLGIDNPLFHARDGIEALQMLRQEIPGPPTSEPIVALLDINMPRMNGHEFLDEIRKDNALRRLPVFVMSTSDRMTDINRAYDHHVTGYVIKPFSMQETYDTIEALVGAWRRLCFPTSQPT
ncbi:MAG: response regulator [Pseudomonadota bacterium]